MLEWKLGKGTIYHSKSNLGHKIYKNAKSDDMVRGVLLEIPRKYHDFDLLIDTVEEAKTIAEQYTKELYDYDKKLTTKEKNALWALINIVVMETGENCNTHAIPKKALYLLLNKLVYHTENKAANNVINIINKYNSSVGNVGEEPNVTIKKSIKRKSRHQKKI